MTRTEAQAKARRALLVFFLLLLFEAFVVYQSIQNENWFAVVGVSLVGIQTLIGGWIYYDMKMRGMETTVPGELDSSIWFIPIAIPVIGLIALPMYLSTRKSIDEE